MSDYDCTPKPEGVIHHAKRMVHNILHPHHKHVFVPLAPKSLMCKAPDMETVTITASQDTPSVNVPTDNNGVYLAPPDGFYWREVGFVVVPGQPQPHASVPEPGSLVLMATALLLLFFTNRRVRK